MYFGSPNHHAELSETNIDISHLSETHPKKHISFKSLLSDIALEPAPCFLLPLIRYCLKRAKLDPFAL